jgi:hypothetical protein
MHTHAESTKQTNTLQTIMRYAPVILPIFEPAISQNRARLLEASFFSLTSFTSLLPVRAITAMSLVGSLRGSTGPAVHMDNNGHVEWYRGGVDWYERYDSDNISSRDRARLGG